MFFSGCGDKPFPEKNMSYGQRCPPGSWEQSFKKDTVEVKKSLIFEAPNKYCISGKLNHTYNRFLYMSKNVEGCNEM